MISDIPPFRPTVPRASAQHIQPSKKFFPPKICQTCFVPFQGSYCPKCPSVPADA